MNYYILRLNQRCLVSKKVDKNAVAKSLVRNSRSYTYYSIKFVTNCFFTPVNFRYNTVITVVAPILLS